LRFRGVPGAGQSVERLQIHGDLRLCGRSRAEQGRQQKAGWSHGRKNTGEPHETTVSDAHIGSRSLVAA
jgi:hypothetical protein